MPFSVDTRKHTSKLICHYTKDKDKDKDKDKEKDKEKEKDADAAENSGDDIAFEKSESRKSSKGVKVARKIFPNDVLRIQAPDKEDAEVTVVSAQDFYPPVVISRPAEVAVTAAAAINSAGIIDLTEDSPPTPPPGNAELISVIGEIDIFPAWNHDSIVDSKVYKRDKAARKQPYLHLLVAKDLALQGKAAGQQSVHEGGFATVYKLMAGEQVECPLCLEVRTYSSRQNRTT